MLRLKVVDAEDTIAAIATPIGIGGIAVIRMSGNSSIDILHTIFRSEHNDGKFTSWTINHGKIFDQDREIDEVLIAVFRRPRSYTREDMVEISCHGGMYVSKKILQLMIDHGARLAEPGEFTKRAFLNGRIDLSQAEAVADIIHAKTEKSLRISLQQLEGNLHRNIKQIRDELIDICSLLEVELDFSEEDLEFVDRESMISKLENILSKLDHLISSYNTGKIIRDGVKLVIVGKPNVGKSSLLNALLREDRAIVTEIPGTTRDSLEEQLDINGVLFRAVDTAGLIETDNIVEQQGIIRTQRHTNTADFILHVFDGSERISDDDRRITQQLIKKLNQNKTKIVGVINKIDLKRKININELAYTELKIPIVETSAKDMIGIDHLEEVLYKSVFEENELIGENNADLMISKLRHWEALKRTATDIEKSLATIKDNLSPEFVTIDLRNALDNLGEIIGEVTNEDILNHIFEKFCIGK